MTLFFFILLYFSRLIKDFSTFSVSWAVVQLIFCPLGNCEVRIGFTTSAGRFGTAPSARRRQVEHKNLAVLRGLSGMPMFYGRQTVAMITDRA